MSRTRRGPSAQQADGLPGTAPLAVARAGLFALVSLALGAASHHLLSGQSVSLPRVGTAALGLFIAGLFGARRRRSLTVVIAACLAAQGALHEVLGGLHVTHAATAATGHGHHATAMAVDGGLLAGHDAWHARLRHSMTMTVAHVLVAVVIAVVLHRADAVCWSVTTRGVTAVALVRAAIRRVFTAWGWAAARWPSPPVLRSPIGRERSPSKISMLADVVVRRGPPYGSGIA